PLGPVRAELVELPLAHEGTSGCSAAWMPLGANAVRNAYGLQPSRRRRGRRGSVWPRLQARPRGKVPTVAIARHYRFRLAALVEWALRRRRAKALRQLLNFAVGVYSRVSPNGLPSESRQIAHRSPGCTTLPPSASTLSSASATSTTAKAPADLERELGEVALDLGDEPAAAHDLTHLGPLAHNVLGQGHAEDVGHSRRAIGLVLIRVHSDHVP